jgi:hypothetical protein
VEEFMHDFSKPVDVLVGLGFPSCIRSVSRAYAVLVDWPLSQRGAMHAAAMTACRAAMSGEGEAETAREAFADFARQAGILACDTKTLVAASALQKIAGPRAPT